PFEIFAIAPDVAQAAPFRASPLRELLPYDGRYVVGTSLETLNAPPLPPTRRTLAALGLIALSVAVIAVGYSVPAAGSVLWMLGDFILVSLLADFAPSRRRTPSGGGSSGSDFSGGGGESGSGGAPGFGDAGGSSGGDVGWASGGDSGSDFSGGGGESGGGG